MSNLPVQLTSGEVARLIPVVADSSKESRAASVLMSGLMSVPAFASALLAGVGQRLGSRTKISCFTEVVFKNGIENVRLRPDGFVIVESGGGRRWSALVEAKIGRAELIDEQIASYCQLGKLNGVDAVITFSNQFAALPTHHPVKLPKQQSKGLELYHWSWMHVLTQALVLLNEHEFEDLTQKYLLDEIVRYFSHESVGVSTFDRMNSEWRDLVVKVQAGSRLSKGSPEVENSVAAWHQESRDLSLLLSRRLNRHVRLSLNRAQTADPVMRLKSDCEKLVNTHDLACVLEVPDAASPLTVTANLARRSLTCSMFLAAPKEKKRTSARVNWLLRQLEKTTADGIFVRAKWPGRAADTQAPLAALRDDPLAIEPENKKLVPLSFEVMMVRDLMGKFSGSRTFIEHVERAVPEFYAKVGQYLRAWVPPPPRIKEKQEATEPEANQDGTKDGREKEPELEVREPPAGQGATEASGRPSWPEREPPLLPAGNLSQPRSPATAEGQSEPGHGDGKTGELSWLSRKD